MEEEISGDLVFICVDESTHSARAFEWYYEHHYREDHTIGIVHIEVDHEKQYKQNGSEDARIRPVMKKSTAVIQKYLQKCTLHGMKTKIFTKTKSGTVGHTICEMVDENKPSMIVIGQRGLGTIQRTIFGSVSDYLLHHAHIPVLIIPPMKSNRKMVRRQTID